MNIRVRQVGPATAALVAGAMVAALVGVGRIGSAQPDADAAMDSSQSKPAVAPATIAIVDIYQIADDLMGSDRFMPARTAKEQAVKDELKPIEEELAATEKSLQGQNPQDEANQGVFREFQGRIQSYQRLRQQRQTEFGTFVAQQYVEAYELGRGSAAAVAESLGYSYVLASRGKDKKITTDNPERLIEALLGRPVLHAPESADITADVRRDLKLE